jgi:hypothetical protein
MKEIVEIIFDKIDKDQLIKVLKVILKFPSNVYKVELQGKIDLLDSNVIFQERSVQLISAVESGYPLIIRAKNITLGSLVMPDVMIRVYHYDIFYDIELSFDNKDVRLDSNRKVKKIHEYLNNIHNELSVENIICGYEPAYEYNNRLFTNNILGPIRYDD